MSLTDFLGLLLDKPVLLIAGLFVILAGIQYAIYMGRML